MRKEKGSITLFILIVCMFMIVILLIVNVGIMNRNRSQEKELEEIAKQYNQNETDLDNEYARIVDENEYATISQVHDIVQEEITNLFPTTYTQLTPVDGVSIVYGGYVQIGSLVVVNTTVRVDTSKVTLSTNNNYSTKILDGLPAPSTNSVLSGYYTYQTNNSNNTVNTWTTAVTDGSLTIAVSKEEVYNSGYIIRICGAYILN